jgi:hypothetical protein
MAAPLKPLPLPLRFAQRYRPAAVAMFQAAPHLRNRKHQITLAGLVARQ